MRLLCECLGIAFGKAGESFFVADGELEVARGENPILVWEVYCGLVEQRGRRALGDWCVRHGRNRYTGGMALAGDETETA